MNEHKTQLDIRSTTAAKAGFWGTLGAIVCTIMIKATVLMIWMTAGLVMCGLAYWWVTRL